MATSNSNRLKSNIRSHKREILYLVFGGVNTFLAIFFFWIFMQMGLPVLAANVVAWVICVIFQFFTNKTWVFKGNGEEEQVFKQFLSFVISCLITLFIEEVILFIFVSCLTISAFFIKILTTFIVIIINYLLRRFWVFKYKAEDRDLQ